MATMIRSVELRSRVRLVYAEQGDPSGIPVLLLHGYTDSWRSFEPVLACLPRSVHAFALSQRGHGESDRPVVGYHPHDFADDLAAFMDELKLGPAIVAGHSMGSTIAQRFALDHPDRVLGLVLVGSFHPPCNSPAVRELWTSVEGIADPIDANFTLEFQRSTLARPVPHTFLATVVQESLKVPAQVWRSALHAFSEADLSDELRRIAAPTLIVWGDQDAYCSRQEQEALRAAIRGSQLVVFSGAGHGLHWEEPERFADLIADFAEEFDWSRSWCGEHINAEPLLSSHPS